MKYIIYPECQGTPTAISADSNYPVANLINNSRKKRWQAVDTVEVATLRCPISANAKGLTIQGTNAESAVCTITLDSAEQTLDAEAAVDAGGGLVTIPLTGHGYSEGDIILLNGTDEYDGVYTLPVQTAGGADDIVITAAYAAETFDGDETACVVVETETHDLTSPAIVDRFWQEYTEQTGAHKATITLTAATGETVYAGVFRAGGLITLNNPRPKLSKRPIDYSEIQIMRDGSRRVLDRDVVRAFAYSMLLTHAQAEQLYNLYELKQKNPFAFLIADSPGNDNLWCAFGAFDMEPDIDYGHPAHAIASVSMIEMV